MFGENLEKNKQSLLAWYQGVHNNHIKGDISATLQNLKKELNTQLEIWDAIVCPSPSTKKTSDLYNIDYLTDQQAADAFVYTVYQPMVFYINEKAKLIQHNDFKSARDLLVEKESLIKSLQSLSLSFEMRDGKKLSSHKPLLHKVVQNSKTAIIKDTSEQTEKLLAIAEAPYKDSKLDPNKGTWTFEEIEKSLVKWHNDDYRQYRQSTESGDVLAAFSEVVAINSSLVKEAQAIKTKAEAEAFQRKFTAVQDAVCALDALYWFGQSAHQLQTQMNWREGSPAKRRLDYFLKDGKLEKLEIQFIIKEKTYDVSVDVIYGMYNLRDLMGYISTAVQDIKEGDITEGHRKIIVDVLNSLNTDHLEVTETGKKHARKYDELSQESVKTFLQKLYFTCLVSTNGIVLVSPAVTVAQLPSSSANTNLNPLATTGLTPASSSNSSPFEHAASALQMLIDSPNIVMPEFIKQQMCKYLISYFRSCDIEEGKAFSSQEKQ